MEWLDGSVAGNTKFAHCGLIKGHVTRTNFTAHAGYTRYGKYDYADLINNKPMMCFRLIANLKLKRTLKIL
jgi:hypothetical protein